MKKIVSIVAILLSVFCMLPTTLSAATATEPVIWEDTDGDGYEDYTDSLGNMWITLTVDENGNRLILSKEILGVTRFNENFDYDQPSHEGDYDNYEGSTLEAEMETFYNGGDADTKINETVYYLAPELKALAQPVVLPDDEVLTQDDGDSTFNELEDAYVYGYSGGMSYVDEAGETTCFALSTSEVFKYLTPNGEANGNVSVPERAAVHSEGSNYADTGTPYSTTDNVGEDKVGGSGWYTRSSDQQLATAQIGANKVSSSGLVGSTYVDTYLGFRPAVWVADDSDGDGLTDAEEAELGTNPAISDTDGDGLTDGDEVNNLKTNPLNIDTDGDKVSDYEEVTLGQDGYITNPLSSDTDDDGLDDREEAANGADPTNDDTDGDGVVDGKEIALGLNPLSMDSDNDGLADGEEITLGTDPLKADSDNDGITDGEEVSSGTDPLVPNEEILETPSDDTNKDDTNKDETLEETGSKPFMVFFAIAVSAFAFALYTRFRTTK